MPKEKSLVKNVMYKSLLSLFNIVVPIIIGSYATKIIGKDGMGEVFYADTIYQYFLIFGAFGIYNYGLREISRIRDNKEKLKQLFSSLFILGVASNVIVLLAYAGFIFFNYKGTSSFSIFAIYLFSIFSNLFYVEWANEALEKYDFITIKTIIVKLIYIVALLTLVKTPEDYLIYAGLISVALFLNNIISFVFIVKDIGFTLKCLTFRRHVKYLIMALIMANGNVLYTQLDKLFLGSNLGKDTVAFYTTPQNVVYMINAFIMSVVYVTIPRLSNILAANDEKAYLKLLNKVAKSLSLFLFPAAMGLTVLAREIILLYAKPEFLPAVPVLQIFTIYMITLAFESILSNQVMYVKKREKVLICFIICCGLFNLIAKIGLTKVGLLTPVTAVITTVIANIILISLEFFYSTRVLNVDIPIFKLDKFKYLFISLLFIPITYGVKMVFASTVIITLVTMILCGSVYFGILLVTKDEVVIAILNKFLKRA